MLSTKKLRSIFWNFLFIPRKKDPIFTKKEFRDQINVHLKTYKVYRKNLPEMIKYRLGLNLKHPISINKIYELYKKHKRIIWKDFEDYLKNKTHFSFDVGINPKPLKQKMFKNKKQFKNHLKNRTVKAGSKNKFGQFIILLLSEYIVLHNRLWCSGLKTKEIKTIDGFLKTERSK
jgi:hypothetical protein